MSNSDQSPHVYQPGPDSDSLLAMAYDHILRCNRVHDYWHEKMVGLGFRLDTDLSLGMSVPGNPLYLTADFAVRFRESTARSVTMSFHILPHSWDNDLTFGSGLSAGQIMVITGHPARGRAMCFAEPGDEEVLHFLRALVEPDLLPTCVGIDWAGDLLEEWLRHQ